MAKTGNHSDIAENGAPFAKIDLKENSIGGRPAAS